MQNKLWLVVLLVALLLGFSSLGLLQNKEFETVNKKRFEPLTNTVLKIDVSPTIENVFQNDHQWVATLPAQRVRVLTATGDIIPARTVNYNAMVRYNNPLWPYEKVAPVLNSLKTDITFINLETPLLTNCRPTTEGMVFCGNSRNVEGLKAIRVDVASLANNHAGNYDQEGVLETVDLLKRNHIDVIGIDGPLYKDIRGVKFAFLGYNDITKDQPGVVDANDELIKKEIAEARKNADIVVVAYHFGVEYRAQPDNDQIRLAHLAIDLGADVVIGNHPHWIQPVELYNGKFIIYAHGNFVFDQMWSQKTREGVIGRYTFFDKKLVDVEFLPLQIDDYGQPHFIDRSEKQRILDEMKQESIKLQAK